MPLRFLLTNDDGFLSPGLSVLKEALSGFGTVQVVAPKKEMSGASVSLVLFRDIPYETLDDGTVAIEGTPADCVSFGVTEFPDIDIVVSGPNNGWNITYDILHSGTCGAAVEAIIYNRPAMAFSFPYKAEVKAEWLRSAIEFILNKGLLSTKYFLNVNFPSGDDNRGFVLSRVAERPDSRYFKKGEQGIRSTREIPTGIDYPEDSDVYLVEHGYTSITPLMGSYFSTEILDAVKKAI